MNSRIVMRKISSGGVAVMAAVLVGSCQQAPDRGTGYDNEMQTTAALHHAEPAEGMQSGAQDVSVLAAEVMGSASAPGGDYRHLHYRQIRKLLISLGASAGGSAIGQLDQLARSLGTSDYALGVKTDLKLTAAKVKDYFRVTEAACSEIMANATARARLLPDGVDDVTELWLAVLTRYPTEEEDALAADLAISFNRTAQVARVAVCVLALNSLEGVGQ